MSKTIVREGNGRQEVPGDSSVEDGKVFRYISAREEIGRASRRHTRAPEANTNFKEI